MSTSSSSKAAAVASATAEGPGKLVFTYFDFASGGRGFMVRAALHHAGVEWEDNRLSFPVFMEAKSKFGLYQTGVPVLQMPNGKQYTQSMAQLRYAGKLANLYPVDPEQALAVDVLLDLVQDAVSKAPGHPEESQKKVLREAYAAGKLKSFCDEIESVLQQDGGKFAVGDSFTVADLGLYFLTDMCCGGNFDFIPVDYLHAFPKIMEGHKRTMVHPVVTSWTARLQHNKAAAADAADAADAAASSAGDNDGSTIK